MSEGSEAAVGVKRRGKFVPGRTTTKKKAVVKKAPVSSPTTAAGTATLSPPQPPEFLEMRGTGTFYGTVREGKPHGDGMLWESRTRRLWIGAWSDGSRRGWFDAYEAPRDVAFDLRERLKRVNRVEDLVSLGRVLFDADGAPCFRHESRRDAASAFSTPPRWRAHRYLGACRAPTDAALREVASLGGVASQRPWWRRHAPFFECVIDPAPAAPSSALMRDDAPLPPTTLRFSFRSNAAGMRPIEAMMKQGRCCYLGTLDDTGERYLDGTLLFLENAAEPDTLTFDRMRDAARRTPSFLPPGRAWRVRRYSAGRPVSDRLHGPGKEKDPDDGRPAPPGVRALRCFFQGYYLRSLLEARWLIFLRTLCPDSAVFYEPYTTVLPDTGQSYTPDFLVAMRVSAQVAHAAALPREAERAIAAGASHSALRGIVFHPDFRVFWLEIKPKPPNHPERWRMRRLVEETGIEGYVFYGQSMDEPTEDLRDRSARARYVDGLHAVHFPAEDPSATVEPMAFAECPACLRFGITMHGNHRDLGCGCEVPEDAVFSRYFSPLHTAYAVARSARVVEEPRGP